MSCHDHFQQLLMYIMAVQAIKYLRRINKPHHILHNISQSRIITTYHRYDVDRSHQQHEKRCLSSSSFLRGSAGRAETTSTTQGLSKLQAQELVLRLNDEERTILISALKEFQSKLVRDEYEGE